MRFIIYCISLLLILKFSWSEAICQEKDISIGKVVQIQSSVLKESRKIQIALPAGYSLSGVAYPVIYLLDGDAHFQHVTGIISFLSAQKRIPPCIVVGIPNTSRSFNLTPVAYTDFTYSSPIYGGADLFLQFLKQELIPFINKQYRTNSFNILIGHSFGGLFAVHALLTKPDIFSAYLALSPSLWWDNKKELQNLNDFVKNNKTLPKFLYMAMGNEGDRMVLPIQEFASILEKSTPDKFRWKYTPMPSENHGSITHRSIYDGLEYLFSPWVYPESASNAVVRKIEKHYENISEEFSAQFSPPENVINALGYFLIGESKTNEAKAMFQYGMERFPESANFYDSMADACESVNDLEQAEINCLIAVELGTKNNDPNLITFKQHLDYIRKKKGSN